IRVPGFMGSLGAGVGSQESFAIVVSPEAAIVRQPVSCCKLKKTRLPWASRRCKIWWAGPGLIEPSSAFFNFLPGASSDISQGLSWRRIFANYHNGLLGHRRGRSDKRLGPQFPYGGRKDVSVGWG